MKWLLPVGMKKEFTKPNKGTENTIRNLKMEGTSGNNEVLNIKVVANGFLPTHSNINNFEKRTSTKTSLKKFRWPGKERRRQ